jgi:hypothetical protein
LPVSDAVVEIDLVVRVNRRLRQRQVLTGGKRHRFYPTTRNANNHCAICVSGVIDCFSGVHPFQRRYQPGQRTARRYSCGERPSSDWN